MLSKCSTTWAMAPTLLFAFCFGDRISLMLPGWSWTRDFPTCTSWVAEITGVSHHDNWVYRGELLLLVFKSLCHPLNSSIRLYSLTLEKKHKIIWIDMQNSIFELSTHLFARTVTIVWWATVKLLSRSSRVCGVKASVGQRRWRGHVGALPYEYLITR
jgi:hypothetical protein